jgi:methionyl aminopeptidase
MTADNVKDLQALKAIGRICADTLRRMMQAVRSGITTGELDDYGRRLLEAEGARSAPQLAYNYPGATCISVAPIIAHGIPGNHVLRGGELIHIDVSAELDGYFADTGASMPVPVDKGSKSARPAAEVDSLLRATKAALWKALSVARAGNPINGIGKIVQNEANKRGYNVISELTGHGIGLHLHEEPGEIWNFHNPGDHRVLRQGQVLALEPFLTTGHGRIREAGDGWSLRTADNAIAAQFEHTIIVARGEPVILTL